MIRPLMVDLSKLNTVKQIDSHLPVSGVPRPSSEQISQLF